MNTYSYEFNTPSPEPEDAQAEKSYLRHWATDALVLTDSAGKVVAASNVFLEFVRRQEAEIVGKPVSLLLPEHLREAVHELYANVFSNAQNLAGYEGGKADADGLTLPVFDARLLSKDGIERVIEISIVPVLEGRETLLLASLRDVTERKQMEASVRDKPTQEAQLRAGFQNAQEAMLLINKADIIVDANPAASRILGLSRQQLVGKAAADLMQSSGNVVSVTPPRPDEKRDISVVIELADVNGQTLFIEYVAMPDDATEYNISVIRDVTERMAEAARLKAKAQKQEQLVYQLTRSQEAERRRLAMDIHDGPLQSIGVSLLALERAMRRLSRGEADIALTELQNLRAGLSDMVVELRAVLADLSQELLATHGLKVALQSHVTRFTDLTGIQVELSIQFNEELPGDLELLLYRLTQESLSNVRKHARAGRVAVSLSGHNSNIVLIIKDNGSGFDLQSLHRKHNEGNKIGIESMRQRVESAGGTLNIASEPGKGTTLVFTFPRFPRTAAPLNTTPLPSIPH